MELSRADFSNLTNAVRTQGQIDTYIASKRASETITDLNAVTSIVKTAADIGTQVYQKQIEADVAIIEPELKAKTEYYTQLLNQSINDGTTKIEKGKDGMPIVKYAQEVLDYKNSWLNDLQDRGFSNAAMTWAENSMDSAFNSSDEYAMLTINKKNIEVSANAMDNSVLEAMKISLQQGSSEYLENFVSNLQTSDANKQAYLNAYLPKLEQEMNYAEVKRLAESGGFSAAKQFIDSLPVSEDERASMYSRASAYATYADNAMKDDTTRTVLTMVENGYSFKQTKDALLSQEGLTSYQKDIISDAILTIQTSSVTELCAPYLEEIASGPASMQRLDEISDLLENNKAMFDGGCENIYERYKGKIETAKANIASSTSKDYQTQAKAEATKLFSMWDSGQISTGTVLSSLSDIAADTDDPTVLKDMQTFISDVITQKVPAQYKATVNTYMNSLKDWWMGYNGVTQWNKLSQEQQDTYNKIYATMYSTVGDYFQGTDNSNFSISDFENMFLKARGTFVSSFIESVNGGVERGVNVNTSEARSTVEAINGLDDLVLFTYTPEDGIKWISDEAEQNWNNVARSGMEMLNKMGYQIDSYQIPIVGDKAYQYPIFHSTNGGYFVIDTDGLVKPYSVIEENGIKTVSIGDPVSAYTLNNGANTNGNRNSATANVTYAARVRDKENSATKKMSGNGYDFALVQENNLYELYKSEGYTDEEARRMAEEAKGNSTNESNKPGYYGRQSNYYAEYGTKPENKTSKRNQIEERARQLMKENKKLSYAEALQKASEELGGWK